MDAIQVTARLTIHEGKLEEFKKLAAQCMRSVRERDSASVSVIWLLKSMDLLPPTLSRLPLA